MTKRNSTLDGSDRRVKLLKLIKQVIMNYEQKYKDALDRAKKLYEKGTITESIGYIFPELTESENEKIRNELIRYFKGLNFKTIKGAESVTRWLAWLEKQGKKGGDE